MAVSLARIKPTERNYFVRISIWGQWYDTELMSSGSAFKAQADAQKEYPGMSVVIYDVSEKATPQETVVETPVRVSLKYQNHTLAAIMRKLNEQLPVAAFESIKIIEDTSTKWAIHTDESYFYTVSKAIKEVIPMNDFQSADTASPEWDLFCSAT